MQLDTVRISQNAKEQLMRLKSRTGIQNWNVLCRWALCVSLAETDPPAPASFTTDSNVEMSWRTFGGEYADLYRALIEYRCSLDGFSPDEDTIAEQFKLHLHRGIGYLFGDKSIRDITTMTALAIHVEDTN
jgi:DNA sulfur modification protein DndE